MKESCFGWAKRLYALLVAFFAFTIVASADGVSITGVQDSFNRKVTLTIGARSENMVLLVAYGAEDKGDDFTTDEDKGGWHYAQPEKFFAAGEETVYDYPMPYDFDETTKYLKFFLLPASQTFMESLANITSSDPANQYIDPEYTLNASSDLRVDVNIASTSLTKGQKVFEIIPDGTSDPYIVFNMYFNDSKYPAYNLRNSTATSGKGYNTQLVGKSASNYERWQMSLKRKQARLDDDWYTAATATLTATPSGQARFYGVGTISKIVIGDDGGNQRWMECAMGFNAQGDLEPGLYCSVTHKFYPSAGSKPFGKGVSAEKFRKDLLKGVPILGRSETFEYVPHEHTWGEWETLTPPTYTEEGLQQHACTVCEETETAPIPKLENDLKLSVSEVTIDAAGCATIAYNLEAKGDGDVTLVAEYQAVGSAEWTKAVLGMLSEIGAGSVKVEGLTTAVKYRFKVYVDAGDHTSEPVVTQDIEVPFSTTTWTGAAETDDNWSTAGNWSDGTVPAVANGVIVSSDYNEKNNIVLDRDAQLSGLVFNWGAKAKFSGGHLLTVAVRSDTDMDSNRRLFCGSTELTVSGTGTAIEVKPVGRLAQSSNTKVLVEGGASFSNDKWRFGDNNNYMFVATNAGSSIVINMSEDSYVEADDGVCKDYLFAAYDGATLDIDSTTSKQAYFSESRNEAMFLADNATAKLTKFRMTSGRPTAICDHGGTLWLGLFTPKTDGAILSSRNGGVIEVRGNLQLSDGGKTATLEVLGAESKIAVKSGVSAAGQIILGKTGTTDKLTVRLAPAADWVTGGARITAVNNATLTAGVKFVVDLEGVTPEMMGKRMPILSCTGTASYVVPGKKDIVRVNNQNYVVTFSKDGKALYMTIDYGPGLMLLLK